MPMPKPLTQAEAKELAEQFEAFVASAGGRRQALEQAERLAGLAERLGGLQQAVEWLRRAAAEEQPLSRHWKWATEHLGLSPQAEESFRRWLASNTAPGAVIVPGTSPGAELKEAEEDWKRNADERQQTG